MLSRRCVSKRWPNSPRIVTRRAGHWRMTSSAGRPTSRFGLARAVRSPAASLGQTEPDDGDGGGGCAVASVVGLSAVLIVQTQAKADLERSLSARPPRTRPSPRRTWNWCSRNAVQVRYDLAVDAIRTFHTGVSEDFLLRKVSSTSFATGS